MLARCNEWRRWIHRQRGTLEGLVHLGQGAACTFVDRRRFDRAWAEVAVHYTPFAMSAPMADYTRISDDAAILLRRQDFPRALNVLQRRAPDGRRWRWAFRKVSHCSSYQLDGAKRRWMHAGLDELLTSVREESLKRELAIDFRLATGTNASGHILPVYTARDLWRIAESFGLPMEYLAHVTTLPKYIDEEVDTAQVIIDCRATANAHREEARRLVQGIAPSDCVPLADQLARVAADAQHDAAARWQALAQRLLRGGRG